MKRPLIHHPLTNLVAFQICWFASVMGAAAGMPWLGPLFAAIWLPLHIAASKSAAGLEVKLILFAGALGYVLDSLIVLGGWMNFPEQARLGMPTTLWMVTLWLGYAATIRHVLGWIRGRYVLAAVLCAFAGPLAYWGGAKLGAVVLTDIPTSLVVVGAEWMLAMPLLLLMVSRLESGACASTRVARQVV